MKKTVTIISILMLLTSCTPEKKCIDFKTGTFKYTHPDYAEWMITRTDSTQLEVSKKSGVKIYSSVNWISDCEYVLTYKKIENSKDSEKLIGSKIEVKIIDTSSNTYTCLSKSANFDLKLELKKID